MDALGFTNECSGESKKSLRGPSHTIVKKRYTWWKSNISWIELRVLIGQSIKHKNDDSETPSSLSKKRQRYKKGQYVRSNKSTNQDFDLNLPPSTSFKDNSWTAKDQGFYILKSIILKIRKQAATPGEESMHGFNVKLRVNPESRKVPDAKNKLVMLLVEFFIPISIPLLSTVNDKTFTQT